MNIAPSRTCTKCFHTGPLEDFIPDKGAKLGRKPICRICWNKARTNWERRHGTGVTQDILRRAIGIIRRGAAVSEAERESWLQDAAKVVTAPPTGAKR